MGFAWTCFVGAFVRTGGQKSRLAFAIICWREPHMLILDEPTNHLDVRFERTHTHSTLPRTSTHSRFSPFFLLSN